MSNSAAVVPGRWVTAASWFCMSLRDVRAAPGWEVRAPPQEKSAAGRGGGGGGAGGVAAFSSLPTSISRNCEHAAGLMARLKIQTHQLAPAEFQCIVDTSLQVNHELLFDFAKQRNPFLHTNSTKSIESTTNFYALYMHD